MNESPAEERLLAHLESLREHPPEAGDRLVPGVIRTARWQAMSCSGVCVAHVCAAVELGRQTVSAPG